ncbi:MAG: hypothetical protein C4542_04825 [Dehalococcoidia bacterium]|nr:MAG: hypothetical protein C4542_04825 [Dehalococcoidia bacterium]
MNTQSVPGGDKATQSAQPSPVRFLEALPESDKIRLKITMSSEFHQKLYEFLERQGFLYFGHEKEGIPLLLKYGLSEVSRTELEKNKEELNLSRYAAMRFQCSEYFAQNMAMTLGLRRELSRNRALKQKLIEKGQAKHLTPDEWDSWDEDFIDGLLCRYVPCK